MNTTFVGKCPYRRYIGDLELLPKKPSALASFQCGIAHRRGQLCGQCEENYTLPLYSYNLRCVKCNDTKYGWIKYIADALTVFYFLVIILRISATSSKLSGFILVSQLLSTPTILRKIYTSNLHSSWTNVSYTSQCFVDLIIAIYAVWNLDFFHSFYSSVCVHQSLAIYHVLVLDYSMQLLCTQFCSS